MLSLFPIIQWLADVAMFVVNVVAFTSYHNKESAPGVRYSFAQKTQLKSGHVLHQDELNNNF